MSETTIHYHNHDCLQELQLTDNVIKQESKQVKNGTSCLLGGKTCWFELRNQLLWESIATWRKQHASFVDKQASEMCLLKLGGTTSQLGFPQVAQGLQSAMAKHSQWEHVGLFCWWVLMLYFLPYQTISSPCACLSVKFEGACHFWSMIDASWFLSNEFTNWHLIFIRRGPYAVAMVNLINPWWYLTKQSKPLPSPFHHP